MKAIVIYDFGGPERLHLADRPMPPIADDQVLVEVRVAGVNPIDWRIRNGQLKQFVPYEFPIILGREVSGVVAAVGAAVTGFQPGDAVFGFLQQRQQAHHCSRLAGSRPSGDQGEAPLSGHGAGQLLPVGEALAVHHQRFGKE